MASPDNGYAREVTCPYCGLVATYAAPVDEAEAIEILANECTSRPEGVGDE